MDLQGTATEYRSFAAKIDRDASRAILVPFAPEYREFQRFGTWGRVNGSKNEPKISALWANSLRVRNRKFFAVLQGN
jgi:hypothetical protein